MKNLLPIIKVAAIFYVIYLTMLFLFQRKMIFPGTAIQRTDGTIVNRSNIEVVWLETSFGKVEAWFGESPKNDQETRTILFAHGNYEIIDHNIDILMKYRKSGHNCFMVEYPGYGESEGSPSKKRIDETFEIAYNWLVDTKKISPKKIIFHGRSLGGGAACSLAEKKIPLKIILQSTYSDMGKFAIRYGAPPFLLLDRFNNSQIIKKLDVPILIIHGKNDTLIPYSHAEELHNKSKDSKLITFDTDHNDPLTHLPEYWESIVNFLQ